MLTADDTSPDDAPPSESTGRLRHTLSGWRQFALVAYRDPEEVPAHVQDIYEKLA